MSTAGGQCVCVDIPGRVLELVPRYYAPSLARGCLVRVVGFEPTLTTVTG